MTAKELRRLLRSLGCVELRQKGSHLRVPGSKRSWICARIERDLEPCLGKDWLRNNT